MSDSQFNPYQNQMYSNSYQNSYQSPYSANVTNYMQKLVNPVQNNDILWVQGIEEAKLFQIPQNTNVILMDRQQDRMYIKSSDNIGKCTIRIFDLKEVIAEPKKEENINLSDYVTKDELAKILDSLTGGSSNEQSVQSTQSKSSKSNK